MFPFFTTMAAHRASKQSQEVHCVGILTTTKLTERRNTVWFIRQIQHYLPLGSDAVWVESANGMELSNGGMGWGIQPRMH